MAWASISNLTGWARPAVAPTTTKPPPSLPALPSGSDIAIIATAGSGDIVEFFRVDNAAAPAVTADPSGWAKGCLYRGSCVDDGACSGPHVSAVADADPAAGFVQAVLLATGVGFRDTVIATATDTSSDTSEVPTNFFYVDLPWRRGHHHGQFGL